MTTIQIELPEATAKAAREAGLLTSHALEKLLVEAIKRQSGRGTEPFTTDDPAFGIWRDRADLEDVPAYVRQLRQGRYNRDGSRNGS
jgi:hypothetical protein